MFYANMNMLLVEDFEKTLKIKIEIIQYQKQKASKCQMQKASK